MNSSSDIFVPPNTILLKGDVYKIMMDFAKKYPTREIIGIYFGIIRDGGILEIKSAFPFRAGDRTDVEFTTEDYEKAVPIIRDEEQRGNVWLGWFHSHPFPNKDSLYMSSTDVKYHYISQKLNPYWTALVLNPHSIDPSRNKWGIKAFRLKFKGELPLIRSLSAIKRRSKGLRRDNLIVLKKVYQLKLKIINMNDES